MSDQSYYPINDGASPEKQLCAQDLRKRMTDAECVLWSRLRGNRLGYHFRRQCVIRGFIVDFYCHAARLVVEVDGSVHDTLVEYDAYRDQVIEGLGILILRLSNDDILQRLRSTALRIQHIADIRTKNL